MFGVRCRTPGARSSVSDVGPRTTACSKWSTLFEKSTNWIFPSDITFNWTSENLLDNSIRQNCVVTGAVPWQQHAHFFLTNCIVGLLGLHQLRAAVSLRECQSNVQSFLFNECFYDRNVKKTHTEYMDTTRKALIEFKPRPRSELKTRQNVLP